MVWRWRFIVGRVTSSFGVIVAGIRSGVILELGGGECLTRC